jgi:hypothetical protein
MALPSYNIHPGYIARLSPEAWDDTKLSPEDRLATQREVYEFAHEIAVFHGCRNILDVGCGSGVKLVYWFSHPEFCAIGTETGPGVDWLRRTYPERWWVKSDSLEGAVPPSDLVICADMVEHLPDPDLLLGYIARTGAKWIVLSTPDRDSLDNHSGPPRNPCHAREWSAPEFAAYIGSHFEVVRHFIAVRKPVCDGGSTQVILCRPKAGGL